jgi:hypothetical protein
LLGEPVQVPIKAMYPAHTPTPAPALIIRAL